MLEDRLVVSFPVQDLHNQYIIYVQSDHLNKEPVRDSLLFHVEDGKNRSPSQRLSILIEVSLNVSVCHCGYRVEVINCCCTLFVQLVYLQQHGSHRQKNDEKSGKIEDKNPGLEKSGNLKI